MKKITAQCPRQIDCLFSDIASVAIAMFDANGNLLDANIGFLQLIGAESQTVNRGICVALHFISPCFGELVSALNDDRQADLKRAITIGKDDSSGLPMLGTLRKWHDAYLLIAEHDTKSLAKMSGAIDRLNDELSFKRKQLTQLSQKLALKERQISELTLSDPLTGLANRRHLEQYLDQECARSDRDDLSITLAIASIDHFDRISDQTGHEGGNLVLQSFAQHLKSAVRTGDFVARMEGEEFVLIYPNTELDQAIEVTDRVRQVASGKICDGVIVDITACYGIAERRPQEDPYTLLQHAGLALHRAKQVGQNQVLHYVPGTYAKPMTN